jgi:nicotinate-nucleotide adenylyltransferase
VAQALYQVFIFMSFYSPHLLSGYVWSGKRVGLFGGSFNPPHEGHLHVSRTALNYLKLDAIWWLVTPQNPHKSSDNFADYNVRLEKCSDLVSNNPAILISDIERQLGVNRSYDTIKKIKEHFPTTKFIWITGMDNARNFHTWYRWRDLLGMVASSHIARPPFWSLIENCPLKLLSTQNHRHLQIPSKVSMNPGNTYWIMQKKLIDTSSTEIRKNL